MAEVGTAYVSIIPSARGFGRTLTAGLSGELDRAGRDSGTRLGRGIESGGKSTFASAGKSLGGAFVGAFAALGIAQVVGGLASAVKTFVGDSIEAASSLAQATQRSSVVFGEQTDQIKAWSSTAAQSFGLSKTAALAAASGFGNMFRQLGFTGEQVATMSTQIVQLSADIGSFNDLPTAEVLDMISASLRGEYDSLQRVIPNINAARVETEALAMTGKDSAKQLTAQERAAATLAIIQRDATDAAGNFAATTGELATQQQIAAAKVADLKTQIGEALLPIAQDAMAFFLEEGVPTLQQFADWVSRNRQGIQDFATATGLTVLSVAEGFLRMSAAAAGWHATVTSVFRAQLTGFAFFANTFLNLAVRAFGWVPGVGDKLRDAQANVSNFSSTAIQKLAATEQGARNMQSGLNRAADAVAGLRNQITQLRDKDVYVRTHVSTITVGGQQRVSVRSTQYRQHGGPVSAYRPYIVGEREPELFIPNRPGTILNQAQIGSLMAPPQVSVYVQAVPDGPWVRSQARVVVGEQNQRARNGKR